MEHELRTQETDFRIHQLCVELQQSAPSLGKLALTPAQLYDSAKMHELRAMLPDLQAHAPTLTLALALALTVTLALPIPLPLPLPVPLPLPLPLRRRRAGAC